MKRLLIDAVVRAAVWLALVAVAILLLRGLLPVQVQMGHLPAANPAQALLSQHGCWTGQAPADMTGKLPGHVVVSTDGSPFYGGSKMVGLALDQLFNHKDAGLTVWGFCR